MKHTLDPNCILFVYNRCSAAPFLVFSFPPFSCVVSFPLTHHTPATAHPPARLSLPLSATLLTIRFSRDRGDVATRLLHLHDFASSELARFKQEESGAVAILAILSPLMGVKIRLGRLDGLLPAAETASALFQTCPGLAR